MVQETDHFYRVILKNVERKPRSEARREHMPIMLGHPDLPVRKETKNLREVYINEGLHMNGILLIPRRSRMKLTFDEHLRQNRKIYYGTSGVKRQIHVEPIRSSPEKATDYALKFMGRENLGFDHVFIRPKTISEQPSKSPLRLG